MGTTRTGICRSIPAELIGFHANGAGVARRPRSFFRPRNARHRETSISVSSSYSPNPQNPARTV